MTKLLIQNGKKIKNKNYIIIDGVVCIKATVIPAYTRPTRCMVYGAKDEKK